MFLWIENQSVFYILAYCFLLYDIFSLKIVGLRYCVHELDMAACNWSCFSVAQIGKRSCQHYRIRCGYSLQFCSGCHCFSGAVLGVEVITQGARSANDFEINPSEEAQAQGKTTISVYSMYMYVFPMLYEQTSSTILPRYTVNSYVSKCNCDIRNTVLVWGWHSEVLRNYEKQYGCSA